MSHIALRSRSLASFCLCVLLLLVGVSEQSCPLQGCQTSRSFAIEIKNSNASIPSPSIEWKTSSYRPSTIGCVSISDQVACTTLDRNGALVVLNSSGVKQWSTAAFFTVTPSLPVYANGMLIYTDGDNFTNHFTNGLLRYNFHPLDAMSLGTTIANNIVAMSTRAGGIGLTTEDGRSSEFIFFDTGSGYAYVIYSAVPVGNQNTIYALGHYFPYDVAPSKWPGHQLFAVDRISVTGKDFFVEKRVVFQVPFQGYDDQNPWAEPAILYANDVVYFRFFNFYGKPQQDYLFAVKDDDKRKSSGTQLWNASYPEGANIQSMAFSNHKNGGLIVAFELKQSTRVQLLSPATGLVLKMVLLEKFFSSWSAVTVFATNPLMVVGPSTDDGDVSVLIGVHAYSPTHRPSFENSVVLISLQESSGEVGKIVWKVPSPDGLPVLGQFAPTADDPSGKSSSIVCATNGTIFSISLPE